MFVGILRWYVWRVLRTVHFEFSSPALLARLLSRACVLAVAMLDCLLSKRGTDTEKHFVCLVMCIRLALRAVCFFFRANACFLLDSLFFAHRSMTDWKFG